MPDPKGRRWDERVDPGDYVEIWLETGDRTVDLGHPVLRGIVDNVRRHTSFQGSLEGGQGVQRWIHINGRNYGAFLVDAQVYYLPKGFSPEIAFVPSLELGLQRYWNIPPGPYSPGEWVRRVVEEVINARHVKKIREAHKLPFPDLAVKASVEESATIFDPVAQWYTGSVWGYLDRWANRPWNELFVRDEPDGPSLIFRPTPWRDLKGQPIQGEADERIVSGVELMVEETGRSRNEVYNYITTYPIRALLEAIELKLALANPTGQVNPWVDHDSIARHGFRPLELPTPWGILQPELDPSKRQSQIQVVKDLCERLNQVAVAAYRDNAWFLAGTLILRGRPDIRPGDYVRIRKAPYRSDVDRPDRLYYVERVQHRFVAFAEFQTSLQVTRGVVLAG